MNESRMLRRSRSCLRPRRPVAGPLCQERRLHGRARAPNLSPLATRVAGVVTRPGKKHQLGKTFCGRIYYYFVATSIGGGNFFFFSVRPFFSQYFWPPLPTTPPPSLLLALYAGSRDCWVVVWGPGGAALASRRGLTAETGGWWLAIANWLPGCSGVCSCPLRPSVDRSFAAPWVGLPTLCSSLQTCGGLCAFSLPRVGEGPGGGVGRTSFFFFPLV